MENQLLEIIKLSKSYLGHQVFSELDLQFSQQKYCIVGENGCGKTTLLLLAAGLEPACSGEILIDKKPVTEKAVRFDIGISSDRIVLPEFLTSKQLLDFHCQQFCCPFPEELIKALHFAKQLTKPIKGLSLGSLKKISLLLALCHQPKYLLLDEPTTGLDKLSREWLLAYLQRYNGCLIVTSHEACFIDNTDYRQINLLQLGDND